MKKPKIAMLVHNPVVNDARVIKQAKTLYDNEYDVHLYGYGDSVTAASSIDNICLTIVDKVSAHNLLFKLKQRVNSGEKVKKKISNKANGLLNKKIEAVFFSLLVANIFFLSLSHTFALNSVEQLVWLLCSFFLVFSSIFVLAPKFRSMKKYIFLGSLGLACILILADVYGVWVTILVCAVMIMVFGLYYSPVLSSVNNRYQVYSVKYAYQAISEALAKEVNLDKIDVVHAHDIIALIAAVKLKQRKSSIKVVWDAHELYFGVNYKNKETKKYIASVIAKSAKYVDYFTTISESFSDIYQKKYPNLPKPIVLMNATKKSKAVEIRSQLLRDATQIDDEQKILLFQGGLSIDRGIIVLLEAAKKLPENWSIVFMGKGQLLNRVKEAAKKLNTNRNSSKPVIAIIPPAPYEELAKWTSGADLGIIPYENTSLNHLYCTPNKLWEYPNAGVPILASKMVEIEKCINRYNTGVLIPREFTAEDILSTLSQFTTESLDALKKNCYQFNQAENWEKYEPRLLAMYKGIKL